MNGNLASCRDNANGCDTSILQKTEFKKFRQEKIVTAFPGIEVLSLEERIKKFGKKPILRRYVKERKLET